MSPLRPGRWLLVPLLAVVAAYAVGAWVAEAIDANPDFAPAAAVTPRQSRAVALTAALIRREIDVHSWTPNDPVFAPGWLLHDMPRYQQGLVSTLGLFTAGLAGRRGETAGDAALPLAADWLRYPATVWRFDLSRSLLPTTSTEKQYRRAAAALESYNQALEDGTSILDRRPEALAAALDDLGRNLGAASAGIEAAIAERSGIPFDRRPAGTFHDARGRLYATALLLRELGWDFAQTISDRGLGERWRRLLDSAAAAAAFAPAVIVNASPDGLLLPNHLAAQGFALLRVRQQMGEMAEALSKPAVSVGR